KAPFEADTDIATAVARLTTPPRPIRLECPSVPAALEQVIDKALTKDPADRWPSALAFRDAVAPFRDDHTPAPARADHCRPGPGGSRGRGKPGAGRGDRVEGLHLGSGRTLDRGPRHRVGRRL